MSHKILVYSPRSAWRIQDFGLRKKLISSQLLELTYFTFKLRKKNNAAYEVVIKKILAGKPVDVGLEKKKSVLHHTLQHKE